MTCKALTTPGSQWTEYCPSFGASALFAVLFGSTTVYHTFQAIYWRKKRLCWILVLGGSWETGAYVCRCIAIKIPTSEPVWDTQYSLVLIAPLLVNAFDYLLLGRMVHFFLAQGRLCGISPRFLAPIFVLCDILVFAAQVVGILFTLSVDIPTINTGLMMYSIGTGIQQFFICSFLVLLWRFNVTLKRENPAPDVLHGARLLTRLLVVSLFFISIRIIFRIFEFGGGEGSSITKTISKNEAYAYVFDAIPMLFAFISVHIIHPGTIMIGPESELPSRKERRAAKRAGARDRGGPILATSVVDSVWGGDGIEGQYVRLSEL